MVVSHLCLPIPEVAEVEVMEEAVVEVQEVAEAAPLLARQSSRKDLNHTLLSPDDDTN